MFDLVFMRFNKLKKCPPRKQKLDQITISVPSVFLIKTRHSYEGNALTPCANAVRFREIAN